MISFQEEKFGELWEDRGLAELMSEHSEMFEENGLDVELDPQIYKGMETAGILLVVTARQNDKLVGYCLLGIHPHNHYRGTLIAMEDSYFVTKEVGFSRGRIAIDLILFSMMAAKARGAKRCYFTSDSLVSTEKLLSFVGMKKVWTVFESDLAGV